MVRDSPAAILWAAVTATLRRRNFVASQAARWDTMERKFVRSDYTLSAHKYNVDLTGTICESNQRREYGASSMEKKLLNIEEAAEYLGVKVQTLYNWKSLGKITHRHGLRKVGRAVRFDLSVLERALTHGEFAFDFSTPGAKRPATQERANQIIR